MRVLSTHKRILIYLCTDITGYYYYFVFFCTRVITKILNKLLYDILVKLR